MRTGKVADTNYVYDEEAGFVAWNNEWRVLFVFGNRPENEAILRNYLPKPL